MFVVVELLTIAIMVVLRYSTLSQNYDMKIIVFSVFGLLAASIVHKYNCKDYSNQKSVLYKIISFLGIMCSFPYSLLVWNTNIKRKKNVKK